MKACPLCGGELGIPQHRRHDLWTAQQVRVVQRLRALGVTQKAIARLVGDGLPASQINGLEHRLRRGQAVAKRRPEDEVPTPEGWAGP